MSSLNEPRAPASVHRGWAKPAPKSKPRAKPTAMLRPPGRPAAVVPKDRAADLAAVLNQYRKDATFRAALINLADRLLTEHGDATTELARDQGWESALRALHRDERYTTILADFMASWKLDRLPVVGDEPAGQQALQSWLLPFFLGWVDDERPSDADALSFGGGVFAGVEVPHLWETDEAGRLRGRLPRTEATLTLTYDPTDESWADAEARLHAEARILRDAIEADYRAAGYDFADVAHRREQHAEWLYRRLVGGLTFPAIAEETNKLLPADEWVNPEQVRIAVHRFADRLRVGLTKAKPNI